MPRIDDERAILLKKKNILKRGFNPNLIDPKVKQEIESLEEKARFLREQAGMIDYIYIPQAHPILGRGLLRKHLSTEWEEQNAGIREIFYVLDFAPIPPIALEHELEKKKLEEIKFNGEQYIRIKVLPMKCEPILRLCGFSADRIGAEKDWDTSVKKFKFS